VVSEKLRRAYLHRDDLYRGIQGTMLDWIDRHIERAVIEPLTSFL
jgi:hypothetical protein